MLAFNPIILNCFKSILILCLRKYLQFHIHYFECLSIPGPYSMAYATCPVTSYYGGNGSRKFKWFVQSHQKPRSEPISVFLPQHPSAFFTFMGGLNFFGKNNVGGKSYSKLSLVKEMDDQLSPTGQTFTGRWLYTGILTSAALAPRHVKLGAWP